MPPASAPPQTAVDGASAGSHAGSDGSTWAEVQSWGRLTNAPHRIEVLADLKHAARTVCSTAAPALPYGCGRSYGDVCLNAGGTLWQTRRLDRFVSFDADQGVLVCESGVTLHEITQLTLPRGWFLPVTPGTQFVSVGGAIANDVHGKNHHVLGSFGHHVLMLELQRSSGERIVCGPRQNQEWFHATLGGLGLTGLVTLAQLQLRRVRGGWVDVQTHLFSSLEEFYALSAELGARHEYCVAWVDALHRGKSPGAAERGVVFAGDHADADALPPLRKRFTVPLATPFSLLGTSTMRIFNRLFYRRMMHRPQRMLQDYVSFFYPLDRLANWNRLYGPAGQYQFQCVVPRAEQLQATRELLKVVTASGAASLLSVLKTFGDLPSLGMLGFPMPGTTLALDFGNRGSETRALLARLASVVAEAGGRIYAAKDASMSRKMFERGYPAYAAFAAFRDPHISSELSRRLLGA